MFLLPFDLYFGACLGILLVFIISLVLQPLSLKSLYLYCILFPFYSDQNV